MSGSQILTGSKSQGSLRRSMTSNPDDDGGSDLTSDLYNDSEETFSEDTTAGGSEQDAAAADSTKTQARHTPVSPNRARFEAAEKENARLFVQCLRQIAPDLVKSLSVWEVDDLIQDLSSRFCASIPHQTTVKSTAEGMGGAVVLNADGVYVAAIAALKLSLRLINCGYYDNKRAVLVPITEADFLNEMFSSGLLLYLPPVWLKEVYAQVLGSSLICSPSPLCSSPSHRQDMNHLVHFIQDLEGSGSTEVSSRLTSEYREELDFDTDGEEPDQSWRVEAGKALAADVLSGCWAQVLDILSVMLNEQGGAPGGGGRYSLSLLLATDSAREDVRRARSAICTSLNGLQKAAKLCCVLGLQQLCGSAFSQLARTSCMKEDFRVTAATEVRGQTKGSVLSSGKPKLVRLHAAHVLSMDVVMTTGLEMASHAADCWKHVFRCCAHISELEHTYFSQGNNQSSLPKVMPGAQGALVLDRDGAEADGSCDTDLYSAPVLAAVPVAPRINVAALIEQSSLESGWDNSLEAGGVLTFAQASKALCGLSQEVDSLFEDAANQLCLDALLGFLRELGDASITQLQRLGGGAGAGVGGAVSVGSSRPPTNALHLYRLQQVLVRVVNSSRPLLHLLRVWSVVSPYLVQATGNADHVISKMAVTSIHEFIVSLVSQREERPHFHVNEFLCKTFEDMLCLELCDGDVQDQIVCCICELVEACSSLLQSGWRPLFGALRSVKIEYTTNEEVNEARRRHVAAVMDVFDVYLGMDNVTVFANATVDCVLCLLKYVHGPATFDSDVSEDRSESGSDDEYTDGEGELEGLCVPALRYLTQVCDILASMWQMPACPVFKGAHRIQVDTAARLVSPEISNMNFKLFAEEFALDKHKPQSEPEAGDVKNVPSGKLEGATNIAAGLDQSGDRSTSLPASSPPQNKVVVSETVEKETAEPAEDSDRPECVLEHSEDCQSQDVKTSDSEVSDADVEVKAAADQEQIRPMPVDSGEANDISSSSKTCPVISSDSETEPVTDAKMKVQRPSTLCDPDSGCGPGLSAPTGPSSNPTLNSHLSEEVASGDCQEVCGMYRSLDEMDGSSGVLHVWFLLLDGLVSAINHCPKAFQSHTLNTLIDLLRSSSKVPGAEFSMYCVNHLLLPMLQSWLRRGARCYGYWNTGIVSFKQSCGLVADLIVEFVTEFTGDAELQAALQLILKQTFDVFIECVAQPVENISRLGCSCIRHILLTAGPHLSETLWQVGGQAVHRALGVTTYNLRLLMALFHPNSDNFYGDIGQVKVATRKDCTVVDCLRLRQMAKQVFLLDSQVSSMPSVQYDTDQDKSFVFLLYPPGHQDSLNPDHISTRVPFRHVVVGLLSNQLLLQTVGEILLDRQADQKEVGSGVGLPGLMPHMSTRNVHQLLSALDETYQTAQDFDARPGLKFLLQKVAGLDVAANLYKQAATAVLFHVHSLLEINAHLDNSSISSTKAAITPIAETPETPVASWPTIAEIKHTAGMSVGRPWTNGRLFLPLLQNVCEELCQTYVEVLQDSGKGSILDKISEQPIFFLTAQHEDIPLITARARLAAAKSRSSDSSSSLHKSVDSSGKNEPIEAEGVRSDGIVSVAVETPQNQLDSDADSDSDLEKVRSEDGDTEKGEGEEEERKKSKREIRQDLESKVYTVATDQVIENLMSQYKRHKHQRSMPNFVRPPKFQRSKMKVPRREAVDEAIDKQHKSSIMKDSEAHLQAWADTLTAILQMTLSLPDSSFSALLPVTFTFVSQLILYATDSALRDQLAQCFNRLGRMYDFAPPANASLPRTRDNSSSKHSLPS
ncbi:brefeldin A-inhibited guanine nucleotide-exchange protein 3 [Aplysia californica]|uniref:Brefeldin A-inhibited guanine nucleotide-exchange protein 3 n=1 Tax=Aplysia californica TaxID=6500 RepID=A0ABM1VSE8_APLCA|nr:brefeldin A-inhibited guanine nucleotide-exchange protein 3 [Aplysia californica]